MRHRTCCPTLDDERHAQGCIGEAPPPSHRRPGAVLVEIDDRLAAFLRPHAERSAAPAPDREPEHRGEPPAPPEPPKFEKPNPAAFTPDAVATWQRVQQQQEQQAGVMALPVGIQPDGNRAPGNEPWEYREPHRIATEAHDDEPIWYQGRWCWQRRPPVHVPGDHPGSPHQRARVARELSEAEAERRAWGAARHELATLDPALSGKTPSQLHRRRRRARQRGAQ